MKGLSFHPVDLLLLAVLTASWSPGCDEWQLGSRITQHISSPDYKILCKNSLTVPLRRTEWFKKPERLSYILKSSNEEKIETKFLRVWATVFIHGARIPPHKGRGTTTTYADVQSTDGKTCNTLGLQTDPHALNAKRDRRGRLLQIGKVAGLLIKGTYIRGFFFSGHKTSLHSICQNFKSLCRGLTGSRHTFSPDGLNNTWLSQGCVHSSHCGNGGRGVHSKDGMGEAPLIAGVQLASQLVVLVSR